jgi:hypothetical protein
MADGVYIQSLIGETSASAWFEKPKNTYYKSNIGTKRLDPVNDVFYDNTTIIYTGHILSSETASITSVWGHALTSNSNSSYVYSAGQLLQMHSIIKGVPLTGSDTGVLRFFKTDYTTNDVTSDTKLGIGNVGIISLKKDRYGDYISPLSFTAITNDGFIFKDVVSSSKQHGIVNVVSSDASSVSSGFLFYDYGIAIILGPDLNVVSSLSSISSIDFSTKTELNIFTAFCTANANEFLYPTNDSAFYNESVTADPDESSDMSLSAFSDSGYHWGASSTTGGHSVYYLKGMKDRRPYITTVGLFNDDNEMLMVAKLAQPILKPKNIPITIRIQYDF